MGPSGTHHLSDVQSIDGSIPIGDPLGIILIKIDLTPT